MHEPVSSIDSTLFCSALDRHRLTESEAARVMRAVVRTCSACALAGIWHRDIKDENMYVQTRRDVPSFAFASDSNLSLSLYGPAIRACDDWPVECCSASSRLISSHSDTLLFFTVLYCNVIYSV